MKFFSGVLHFKTPKFWPGDWAPSILYHFKKVIKVIKNGIVAAVPNIFFLWKCIIMKNCPSDICVRVLSTEIQEQLYIQFVQSN